MKAFTIAALIGLTLIGLPLRVAGAVGDQYLVNVRSASVFLGKAANALGTIEFFDNGSGGRSYDSQITRSDGAITQNRFGFEAPPATPQLLALPNVGTNINWSNTISWYTLLPASSEFSNFGTATFQRAAGFSVGNYEITGTPIGTVTGTFRVVEFRGILTEVGGTLFSGTLLQQYPYPGVQNQLVLGPASDDDVIGTEGGRNYSAGFSSGLFLITEQPPFGVMKQWTRLSGSATKLGQAGDVILEIESAESVGGAWQPVGSIPLPSGKPSEVFRLKIRKQ